MLYRYEVVLRCFRYHYADNNLPSVISYTKSPPSAMLLSWVTMSIDTLKRSLRVSKWLSTVVEFFSSKLPVGSSASRRAGLLIRALAIETLCCSPPESWLGRCSVLWLSPNSSRSSLAKRLLSFSDLPSYWPYATIAFDYIRRAMPYTAPGSLSADEVYAIVAYLLSRDGVVPKDAVLDAEGLAAVKMPNAEGFYPGE